MEKKVLRKSLIKQRQSLSVEEWQLKSDRLCEHLKSAPSFAQSQTILAYFSFRQEPDLTPLFKEPYQWGFPRCVGQSLVWHCWQPGDALETGAYGIREPDSKSPILSPEQVDLILIPAVACDLQGYRLGYGGGFYDRLLSDRQWSQKPTIGIVFEFARLPELPIDAWDKPLNAICTDDGFFECE
jgi:5-formyltetrahydrofolate cyclo-ligase